MSLFAAKMAGHASDNWRARNCTGEFSRHDAARIPEGGGRLFQRSWYTVILWKIRPADESRLSRQRRGALLRNYAGCSRRLFKAYEVALKAFSNSAAAVSLSAAFGLGAFLFFVGMRGKSSSANRSASRELRVKIHRWKWRYLRGLVLKCVLTLPFLASHISATC